MGILGAYEPVTASFLTSRHPVVASFNERTQSAHLRSKRIASRLPTRALAYPSQYPQYQTRIPHPTKLFQTRTCI